VKPEFITFTGADQYADIAEMEALSAQYPIEWGILFSQSKRGTGRYPSLEYASQIARSPHLRCSAHICGVWSQDLLCWGQCPSLEPYLSGFSRCQVNTRDYLRPMSIRRVNEWAHPRKLGVIFQCRGAFPAERSVAWLFDQSGGRGILPDSFPERPEEEILVGYAGGLRPENVASVVAGLSGRYWIDLESGVRTEQDRFSVAMCRRVCEAIYLGGE
jgi:hypothetical protein